MPPKKNTRAQSKAVAKKKKDEEEEESEEEEDTKKTQKGKKGAKGKMDVEDAPAPRRSTRSSSRKAAKDDDEEEESDEDTAGKKPTKKVKRGRGKKADDDDEDDDDEDDAPAVKKAIVKGGAAVDSEWTGPDCHVYNDGKTVYTTTMNQSNLNRNNNKFYIVQLLETEGKTPGYYTWNRWGRVGVRGQTKATRFGDVNKAIKDYEKKIHEKSVKGDYKVIDINYDDEEEEDKKSDTKDDKKKTNNKKDDDDDDDKKDKKEPAKKAAAKKKDDDDDDDKKDKKEPAKKPSAKKKDDDDEEEDKQVKVITKGGIAIDQYFPDKDCELYSANGKIYAKTLNQSNLNHNNNKFYIIQVLKDTKKPNTFYTWNRWGRVGVPGQNAKKVFSDAASAIADFEKKLHDKTVKGDYREVEINYDDDEEEEETKKDDKKDGGDTKTEESKLPGPVKDLIKLIFDLKMMNEQMKEIGYDPKKMPLGKLAKSSVQKGYEVLKQIAEAIEKGKSRSVLNELSGDFYSLIPHDFGFQHMSQFVIDTDKKVKAKLEMLNSLADIQIATKLLSSGDSGENQFDSHYKKLKCELVPVEKNTDEHKMVLEYIKNTHASTHSNYSLELVDLFTTARDGEDARYNKSLHNKMLLWHGSRLTNYVGILSQGLRIAPPEAPVTGYMFGKGVYFADMVSKSANYCFTNSANNTGIMLLCEVALGNCNEKLHADYYAANLPPGKHSTKGLGKTAPPASSYKKIDGDVQVPIGKGENTGVQNAALLYNEYIVYDINQIKLKYLLRLKFNYRSNY